MKVLRSTYIPVLACGSREKIMISFRPWHKSNERWPTPQTCGQSLNSGEKKSNSDNFVDSFELHLELGKNMNATAVVLIAFWVIQVRRSLQALPAIPNNWSILVVYNKKNEFFACRNDGHILKPTSKWPMRDDEFRHKKSQSRIIRALALYIINRNNIVSVERSSSIQAHSRPSDPENPRGWVYILADHLPLTKLTRAQAAQ